MEQRGCEKQRTLQSCLVDYGHPSVHCPTCNSCRAVSQHFEAGHAFLMNARCATAEQHQQPNDVVRKLPLQAESTTPFKSLRDFVADPLFPVFLSHAQLAQEIVELLGLIAVRAQYGVLLQPRKTCSPRSSVCSTSTVHIFLTAWRHISSDIMVCKPVRCRHAHSQLSEARS